MINVELYINGKLCDITNPYDLGVRFQREILIPSEITSKDVQYSFTIKIPFSATNNEIFNYGNQEEVKNKFNHLYEAELIVDSVKIFDGLFKLSSIDNQYYKGNLYKPVEKTIKDIFGDKLLNENGKWEIDFNDFQESISKYNTDTSSIQPCIFPFVLYGLIPKVSTNPNAIVNGEVVGDYTRKDLWDDYVRLGIEDFPPSVNCLQMLKKIFENNGLTLGGTAFEDTRLTNLYTSYKNEADYVQEWNWGTLGKFKVSGSWESVENRWGTPLFERRLYRNETESGVFYTCDLLNCNRVKMDTIEDNGTNVLYAEYPETYNDDNYKRKTTFITIPKSGLYKIRFTGAIELENSYNHSGRNSGWKWEDSSTGHRFTSAGQHNDSTRNNRFTRKRYELQVVRDFGKGDFNTENKTIVGYYFRPNNPQNNVFNGDSPENYPKYFPSPYHSMLIDASTDECFLNGLHWGRVDNDSDYNPRGYAANYMFIKNGYSWDNSYSQSNKIYSAYNCDVYNCWGTDEDATIELDPETGEEVEGGDDEVVLSWKTSNKYTAKLKSSFNVITQTNDCNGGGYLDHIVYLEKGEHITVLFVGEGNDLRRNTDKTKWNWGCACAKVDFTLQVEPFRTDVSWIKINNNSTGYAEMNILDESNFRKTGINLIDFLPAEKTNEWIENFTKTFNLNLVKNGTNNYDLNVKQSNNLNTSSVISLENKANIEFKTNEDLGLPATFDLGFTINEEEEGYVKTLDDGGGVFDTGTLNGNILEHKSKFSYNWFKTITKNVNSEGAKQIELPIISNYEVWDDNMTYGEGFSKVYTNYKQRFWYRNGLLNTKAGTIQINNKNISIADVSNTFNQDRILHLNYNNKSNTILTTYFSVITSNDSNYTEIECYLTPDEYEKLNGSHLIKWNGDLYYISSVDGYDITEKNKTKLRLIKKINL